MQNIVIKKTKLRSTIRKCGLNWDGNMQVDRCTNLEGDNENEVLKIGKGYDRAMADGTK